MPEPAMPQMLAAGEALVSASPFTGVALPEVDGVASVKAAAPSGRYVLRTDLEAARRVGIALGVALDTPINRAVHSQGVAALRLGPDEWFLLADVEPDPGLPARISEVARGAPQSLVDVGHRTCGLLIEGAEVEAVLAAGCPLPLAISEFAVGKATRTVLAKAEIILWRRAANSFQIEIARSYVVYVVELLATVIAGEAAILRQERRI